jgi:hypothetical protein
MTTSCAFDLAVERGPDSTSPLRAYLLSAKECYDAAQETRSSDVLILLCRRTLDAWGRLHRHGRAVSLGRNPVTYAATQPTAPRIAMPAQRLWASPLARFVPSGLPHQPVRRQMTPTAVSESLMGISGSTRGTAA